MCNSAKLQTSEPSLSFGDHAVASTGPNSISVLADSAKLGKDSFVRIAPLDRVRILVTDAEPEGELAQALADAGVEVVLAEN